MTQTASLFLILLLLAAVFAWLVGRPKPRPPEGEGDRERDNEMLGEAENEVRELDTMMSPEEAEEELPDWGPGAPKT